jgi:hypothetical protein
VGRISIDELPPTCLLQGTVKQTVMVSDTAGGKTTLAIQPACFESACIIFIDITRFEIDQKDVPQ